MDAIVEKIARDVFMVETLQTRNRDALDFVEVSVGSIKDALTQAYLAGKASNSEC